MCKALLILSMVLFLSACDSKDNKDDSRAVCPLYDGSEITCSAKARCVLPSDPYYAVLPDAVCRCECDGQPVPEDGSACLCDGWPTTCEAFKVESRIILDGLEELSCQQDAECVSQIDTLETLGPYTGYVYQTPVNAVADSHELTKMLEGLKLRLDNGAIPSYIHECLSIPPLFEYGDFAPIYYIDCAYCNSTTHRCAIPTTAWNQYVIDANNFNEDTGPFFIDTLDGGSCRRVLIE